jgi:hypothetical protein
MAGLPKKVAPFNHRLTGSGLGQGAMAKSSPMGLFWWRCGVPINSYEEHGLEESKHYAACGALRLGAGQSGKLWGTVCFVSLQSTPIDLC